MKPTKTVVLVYSGGLDTSVCIPFVKEEYGYERVVTVTVDVGQPESDIREAAEKAKAMGTEHYTVDAKEEFAKDFCFAAVKANALYEGYPLSTSIARPIIAAKAVEVAKKLGASAFAHGCTGKGNDQFRIEFAIRALMPLAVIHAPIREKNMTRSWEIEYAQARGVPIKQSVAKIWSIDENLWGRSIEGGRLEEPDFAPPEEIFQWTKSPTAAADKVTELRVDFENGVPAALDGEKLLPAKLIAIANKFAGENGIGRIDIMEDRMLGLKVRENYECPGSTLLLTAHKALEALVLTRDELRFKAQVDSEWSKLAYEGLWWDPFKESLESFIGSTQKRVTGSVTMRLYKGSIQVIGRKSPWALYNEDLASFDTKTFEQSESTGTVKNFGLQARMYFELLEKMGKRKIRLSNKLWGGRFDKPMHTEVEAFTASIGVDGRLWNADITGSIAHARMLGAVGALTEDESAKLIAGLQDIRAEVETGKVSFRPRAEDIHSEIERLLTEKLGPVAGKLHTARSRNDQVVTATRLYLRNQSDALSADLRSLQTWLVDAAENHCETILPGLTHTQHAQPISLAHHLMAYFWMFQRDAERLASARIRINVLPLGSAALAGTSFPLDRKMVAAELGFERVSENSLDAVSDRDFVVEFLSACTQIMTHLSRLSEELILWSMPELGFVQLDDSVTTGSSIMPQKKNPDVAELIRGKVGRVTGALVGALTMLKALPLSYNRDLQEDKTFLFEGLDTTRASARLMQLMLENARFKPDRMAAALKGDFSNATDLADYLARKGMPFRQAHEVVGGAVRACLDRGCGLEDLSAADYKKLNPLFGEDVLAVIQPLAVMQARTSEGGTASARVKEQIAAARAIYFRNGTV